MRRISWLIFTTALNIIIFFAANASGTLKASILYNSIDPLTFARYSSVWNSNHQSWISIDANEEYCDSSSSWTTFPVCSGDYVIEEDYSFNSPQSQQCKRTQCLNLRDGCGVTPRDTVDYLPPASLSSLDTSSVCSPSSFDQVVSNYSYGLDQGISPDFTPISPIGLKLSGYIFAQFNGICRPVPNAKIVAWQLDAQLLSPLNTFDTKFFRSNSTMTRGDMRGPYTDILDQRSETLRSTSCRGQQHANAHGFYNFTTSLPPSYGPPRHIMVTISAAGFQTVTTRVYFDRDWRLQQLTTAGGDTRVRTADSPPQAHGFATDHKDYSFTEIYPGNVAKDPRVAKLTFKHEPLPADLVSKAGTTSVTGLAYGHFEVQHNFYLAPVRSSAKNNALVNSRDQSEIPPYDVQGLWSDSQGGLIAVETHGNVFIAREVPHPRTWHVLWGYLVGNTIRGVRFHNRLYDMQDVKDLRTVLEDINVITSEQVHHSGYATGVIVPTDSFQSNSFAPTNPQAMTIDWAGGDLEENGMSWSKQSDRMSNTSGNRYRYLKLLIVRATGLDSVRLHNNNGQSTQQQDRGQVHINEIEFFESILANEVRPSIEQKMKSARFPSPFVVTCSSFDSQDHHCYKAFDGDASSKSAWVTQPLGIRRNVLSEPQWTLFDFGAGHTIHPTALRIVCDAANTMDPAPAPAENDPSRQLGEQKYSAKGGSGCPMTFMLQGSNDLIKFDTLYRQDLYDYARNGSYLADYPPGGRTFYFPYDSLHGRGNGQRCGSCDTAPEFICQRDSYDLTCDSRYCGTDGLCAPLPSCPVGMYLLVSLPTAAAKSMSLYRSQAFRCAQCPAGRFGDMSGLRSVVCSGICAPGYSCPAGSTSAKEIACSAIDKDRPYAFYCPEGSGSPLQTPSGQRTVLEPAQDRVVPCEAGAFCIQGVQYPCPVGRYGARGSLAQADCTAHCPVGYYCSQTTDNPWINLQQNVSDRRFVSSTTINYLGIGNVNPVVCPKGYYCPDGRYKIACPAGRYGEVTGLRDSYCSGPCAEGHYCPSASFSPWQIPCPAGRYGNVTGLSDANCAGPCVEGYFCPTGTADASSHPCGGAHVYCPIGSSGPVSVTPGYFTAPGEGGVHYQNQTHQRPADRGFYAQYGRRFACPAGTFGNVSGLNADQENQGGVTPTRAPSAAPSASPTRKPSYQPSYAPSHAPSANPQSQAPTLTPMPSRMPTLTPTLAPTPSAAPTLVPTFAPTLQPIQPTYSPSYQPSVMPSSRPTGAPTFTMRPSASPTVRPSAMPTLIYVNQLFTSRPSYAPSRSSQAVLTKFLCSGYCQPGYYCPTNSTSSTQIACPAGRYGDRFGLQDAYCAGTCPLGHYCPTGTVNPIPCPPGIYHDWIFDGEREREEERFYSLYCYLVCYFLIVRLHE